MGEIVFIALIFYGIPALCAIAAMIRTSGHKAELHALNARVAQLETQLAAQAAPNVEPVTERAEIPAEQAFVFDELEPDKPAAPTAQTAPDAQIEQIEQIQFADQIEQAAPDAQAEPAPFADSARDKPEFPSVLVTLWSWFRANPILYIGLGVFLTGMAFGLNYLTFAGYLTVEVRLAAAALVGAAFLGAGWKLHNRNALVSQALLGGGSVILYLTLFMTARLQVLGMTTVFMAMVVLVIAATLLAVKINAHLLAVLSTAGGFAVPVLLATETGNHIGLFSYYALLTAGNLLLLRLRAWDIPALVSFAAVSVVGGLWANSTYKPGMFPEMEGFLILFFLLFSVIQLQMLRHAQEMPEWSKRLVHASYLFGLPLAAFGCQYWLVQPYAKADAVSALTLGAWYLSLYVVQRKKNTGYKSCSVASLVRDAFLILGVGFVALCVPLALQAPWITCTWALQGAGLVWLGIRQTRRSLRCTGYALQLLGFADLLQNFSNLQTPVLGGITNGFVIGVVALCLSGLAILRELHARAAYTESTSKPNQPGAYAIAQIWVMFVWILVIFFQIDCIAPALKFSEDQWFNCLAMGTAVSAFVWFLAGLRYGLRLWLYPVQGIWLLLFMYLPSPEYWSGLVRPMQGAGFVDSLAWANFSFPSVLLIIPMAHYAVQRAPELWQGWGKFDASGTKWLNTSLAALWLFTVFFAAYQWGDFLYPAVTGNAYAAFFWMLLPAVVLILSLPRVLVWLIRRMPLYQQCAPAVAKVLGFSISCWLIIAFLSLCEYDGNTLSSSISSETANYGSSYVPLFSWVDATQILLLVCVYGCAIPVLSKIWITPPNTNARLGLGIGVFFLSTTIAARTVSAVTGVPYEIDALLHDPAFRFVLSVLWGGMALGLMLASSRLLTGDARRPLWFAGAGLLVLTMLKLLLLDMADRSTVYRMVSFLSLGLLMLGMGYFCPLPPQKSQDNTE